jgi:hypothetical protein
MPQVIAGAAVAGGAAWFVSGASAFMPVFATTLAAGFVGQLITPEPSLLSNRLPQDRQVSGRSTLASRRYVLGRAQLAAATWRMYMTPLPMKHLEHLSMVKSLFSFLYLNSQDQIQLPLLITC